MTNAGINQGTDDLLCAKNNKGEVTKWPGVVKTVSVLTLICRDLWMLNSANPLSRARAGIEVNGGYTLGGPFFGRKARPD